MQWTELLPGMMNQSFGATDGLMKLVSDEELDWKPATGKNWMTVGQLLMHLTNSCGFCCRGFDTGDWSMPDCDEKPEAPEEHDEMLLPAEALPTVSSVQEARDLLAEDKLVALNVVASAGEERLDKEMSSAPWEPDNSRSLGFHCLNMNQHLDSHRHQLFYYLKLMGKDVNTMNLWGM